MLSRAWSATISAALILSATTYGTLYPPNGVRPGTVGINATFDYVIVGGGTAGLTVAARLAESPSTSVAVIEAGGFYEVDNGNLSVVPGFATFFSGTDPNNTNSLIDWGFVTTPQAGAAGRSMHYAQGKTMGGSSARNFMAYHRPTTGSLRQWADAVGDPTYTMERFLSFYKRSVDFTPATVKYSNSTNLQNRAAFARWGGPLQVSLGNFNDPFATWVQRAFHGIGQSIIDGFQTGQLLGTSYVSFTVDPKTAHRSSSESSFLRSLSRSASLTIYNNTMAQKLLFDYTNTARGVMVASQGSEYVLNARKQVILSTGAFKSPQLLMISGIGPRKTLESHGIRVLIDLPGVGQNLQDQPFFGISHRVNMMTVSASLNNASIAEAATQAYLKAQGPLTNPSPGPLGWEKLPQPERSQLSPAAQVVLDTKFPADWPEIEYLPIDAITGYSRNFQTADPVDGYNYATIDAALMAPLSRGDVSISSANIQDPPLINPNWLTHPVDVELAIAAFKRLRQAWAQIRNITMDEEWIPGPKVNSDAQILAFIREAVAPMWHAASTCKMGKAGDVMAVVDSEFRVMGTKNLRVVDASVMPFLPPGHTQSTVYALAEKLAATLLGFATS